MCALTLRSSSDGMTQPIARSPWATYVLPFEPVAYAKLSRVSSEAFSNSCGSRESVSSMNPSQSLSSASQCSPPAGSHNPVAVLQRYERQSSGSSPVARIAAAQSRWLLQGGVSTSPKCIKLQAAANAATETTPSARVETRFKNCLAVPRRSPGVTGARPRELRQGARFLGCSSP
jgi:hypothetical protein